MAIAVLLFALLAPEEGPGLMARLRSIYGEGTDEDAAPAAKTPTETLRAGLQAAVGEKLDRSTRGTELSNALVQADLKLRAAEWLGIVVGVSAVAGLLLALRTASPIGFVVGAVIGAGGCRGFLKFRQSRRRRRFENQLSSMILSTSNGLKAGYTFSQAIDAVSRTAKQPMASELWRVVREMQLGVSVADALGKMVKRNDSEDLRLMLTAVQIQQQVGGNLAQILDNIEFTIRERVRIKGDVKTLTSQARVSGWILTGLPFALGGVLTLTAPTYFTPMFSNLIGQIMLGICGFSLFMGYLIIRKIVNVEV
ncbi:MAG: type II secretion system F family protein [Candidatus Dormibacteria bacterium]